ncbi:MAG TPA: glycosyltransferase [Solirubrobacteraceae bacterium]|jgi:GT2 family glycosyltransferase|nr:glycosyltransferase [Solirubrobacteraceae bacterium]
MRPSQADTPIPDAVPCFRPAAPASPLATRQAGARPEVHGKFFRFGEEKLYLRGVTYGPFAPGSGGEPYDPGRTREDFARMVQAGVNVVRLYTPPPLWLLDAAAAEELLVFAGLAWEEHITFLAERRRASEIVERARSEILARVGHPALLAWAIGNEIPAPIVRWHGADAVRSFLARLYDAAKEADPGAAVTYVNYPTTEYLELDFLDFICFNVFLEQPGPFEAYLDRLQNLAGDRPLVLTEIGLDSGKHGEDAQAESIDWQVRSSFAAGCAGAIAFSWTDEWHRGGAEITDWRFGLTDRDRVPKPALSRLSEAFSSVPLDPGPTAPRVSVLICTYNGARTLGETCAAVSRLDYPDVEVIVVDDGSTDDSARIAEHYGSRVISTDNRGLSSARNTALAAATGEIVAFLDDDAMPDPDWLTYLVDTFARTDFAAVGGPNLPVPGDGAVADAVAAAPGNPIHVLVGDREAEHIPGCNSAFRTSALREIDGFDPQFRTAGDDVDVCWRLQDRGWRIGYSPAAVVWHHRRTTVRGYLRQQRGYGHAEAKLERKWPARYSAGGHVTWRGRVYGGAVPRRATGPLRWRVYHGVWGTAPFQSLYEPARGDMNAFILMPEVYLAIGLGTILVAVGALWTPLLLLAPVLIVLAGALAVRAVTTAAAARFPTRGLSRGERIERRVLTALLHVVQPLVRLEGRLRDGLTPWRRFMRTGVAVPVTRRLERWSEDWIDPTDWVCSFEREITAAGAVVRRGGDFDSWDLETRGGVFAGVRVTTVVEEHGAGGQLVRTRCRPTWSKPALAITSLLLVVATLAAIDGAAIAASVLAVLGVALGLRTITEASSALALTARVVRGPSS